MNEQNLQNKSIIGMSSVFEQAISDSEYESEEVISRIEFGEVNLILEDESEVQNKNIMIRDTEKKYDCLKQKQKNVQKQLSQILDSKTFLKGINFNRVMNQDEFEVLKKNIKRARKIEKLRNTLKRTSLDQKYLVQCNQFQILNISKGQKIEFIELNKQLLEEIQVKGDYLCNLNKFIEDICQEIQEDVEIINIMADLRIMIEDMQHVNFNWMLHQQKIHKINKLFEFFISIVQENFHYNFINLNPIIQKLPIQYMLQFFKHPLYDNSDWKLQETVNRFFVNILTLFNNFYLRYCLVQQQVINIKQIQTIDPFLRMEIRKKNLLYFQKNFWQIKGFELYDFVCEIIDKMILTILPKFQYQKKQPLILSILGFILDLYRFGLVSFVQNKKMLYLLYLISEVLISYEQQIIDKQEKIKKQNEKRIEKNLKLKQIIVADNIKENFLKCKEHVCSILIHQAAVFCDVTFEEAIKKDDKAQYDFKTFLMNDQTNFAYFSSISIKYLSQYLCIQDKEITSQWLQEGISILYNFIGDYQNDFFIQSLYLLKKNVFEHHYSLQYLGEQVDNTDAQKVIQYTTNFLNKIKDTQRKNFQIELESYFQSIYSYFDNNYKNKNFNIILSRNNLPYFILMFMYYLDSITKEPDLFDKGFYFLKIIIQNNYTGQGIIFRGDSIIFFRQLMLNKIFGCTLLIREVFKEDSSILFISSYIFKLIIDIYSQFLDKLARQLQQGYQDNSTISLITILFLFSFYFMNFLEDHEVKEHLKKKFHLVIAERLSKFFTKFVFPRFFIDKMPFVPEDILIDIVVYGSSDYNKFEEFIVNTDVNQFLEQLYYVIFRLFNKATYNEYSGNVYEKIFEKLPLLDTQQTTQVTELCLLIRQEKLKLRNNFQVFYTNNLITQREKYNPKDTSTCGEQCVPNNHYVEIFDIIFDELKFFQIYKQKYPEVNEINNVIVDGYLFKGLLNIIYKYLQGIRQNFYNFVEIPDRTQLEDSVKKIIQQLNSLDEQDPKDKTMKDDLKKNYSYIFSTDDFLKNHKDLKKYDEYELQFSIYYYISYRLQKLVNILTVDSWIFDTNDIHNQKIFEVNSKISSRIKRPKIIMQVKKINFKFLKNHIKGLLQYILEFLQEKYMDSDYLYIIEKYTLYQQGDMKKKYLNQTTLLKLSQIKTQKDTKKEDNSYYNKILKPFKQAYKKQKKEAIRQEENNQFIRVLSSKKDSNKNLKNLVYYFIAKINQMEILMTKEDFSVQFLYNEYYTSLIIIIGNLISWKRQIKHFFLKLIKQDDDIGKRARKTIQKLSQCQFVLFKIVLYKTFQDDIWKDYWSKFYIISRFMQRLCQNNDIEFKKVLSSYDFASGVFQIHGNQSKQYINNRKYSYFYELYTLCETSASENTLCLSQQTTILQEDKPQNFKLIQRLIQQVTEYVQGQHLQYKKAIYDNSSYVWINIILRVVDNIDDEFYQLSMSIVQYLDALIDGLDKEIVSFFCKQVDVNQIFCVIQRLIHKLYIRQIRYIKKTQKKQGIFEDEISIIQIEDEQQIPIESFQILLDMYKKYDNFANHQVLKYASQLYIFIQNLSIKIRVFSFFFENKNDKMQKYIRNEKYRQNLSVQQRNEFCALNFLKKIILYIEVIIEQQDETVLQNMFFQRPPETFFMGEIKKFIFVDNMNIESIKAVHQDFYSNILQIHEEMILKRRDYIQLGPLYYFTTPEFFYRAHQILYIISFFLNIIMTYSIIFQHYDDENVNVAGVLIYTNNFKILIDSIGFFIAIVSSILSILWVVYRYTKVKSIVYIEKTRYRKKLNFVQKLKLKVWNSLISNKRFISFLLHAVFSFMGLFFSYFYFTLNLLLISNLSKTIEYIMKSLIQHQQKFAIVLALTLMIVLSYSFLMLRYFSEQINSDQFGGFICNDFFGCYFNSVNQGIKSGGGLSDPLTLKADPNEPVFWGRFFFDISFFFIVKLFLLNIVAGIIIESFSELRDQMNHRTNFKKNICFVCGLSKWQIEKKGQSYNHHINQNHKMWDYLYFITKLLSTDVGSMNGLEYQIYTKYEQDNTSWIPQRMFLNQDVNYMKLNKDEQIDFEQFLENTTSSSIFVLFFLYPQNLINKIKLSI